MNYLRLVEYASNKWFVWVSRPYKDIKKIKCQGTEQAAVEYARKNFGFNEDGFQVTSVTRLPGKLVEDAIKQQQSSSKIAKLYQKIANLPLYVPFNTSFDKVNQVINVVLHDQQNHEVALYYKTSELGDTLMVKVIKPVTNARGMQLTSLKGDLLNIETEFEVKDYKAYLEKNAISKYVAHAIETIYEFGFFNRIYENPFLTTMSVLKRQRLEVEARINQLND